MYGTKGKYTRRYARKGRASKVVRMAKGKVSNVQALAKAVSSLKRSMRTQHQYLNYSQGSSALALTGDVQILNLSAYSAWNPLFGTTANDATDNRAVHSSFGLDMYFNCANEIDRIGFTVFLVSLKDSIGSAFTASSGALSLVNGDHYAMINGQALLNKKVFTIHKTKRFELSNNGTALTAPSAQTQFGTDRRFYWKCRVNKMIINPTGDWKSMSSAQDPSKNYYLLVFNDNSAIDLQNPTLSYAVVHTIKTVG